MNRTMVSACLLMAISLGGASRGLTADEPANLIPGGDFQACKPGDPLPKGAGPAFFYVREDDNVWLKLVGTAKFDWRVPLPKDLASLKFSGRMRTTDVVVGAETWQDARIAVDFVDAQGKHTGYWPKVLHAKGTTGWVSIAEEYRIPPGAVAIKVSPSNFGASGTVEFDDIVLFPGRLRTAPSDLPPPDGFVPDPPLARAWRSASETQERICLNSLWQFFPVSEAGDATPPAGSGWGWFKVPGIWPTMESYGVPPAEQTVHASAAVADTLDVRAMTNAWYKRTVVIPPEWRGRKVSLEFTMLQSYAKVFVDGQPCGELLFPGGSVGLGDRVVPGKEHEIALLVKALPLAKNRTVFMAPDRAFAESGELTLRGITGDLYLTSETTWGLRDVRVETSVKEKSITFNVDATLLSSMPLTLEAEAWMGAERTVFPARGVSPADSKDGRVRLTFPWENPKLWDLNTPQNQYQATVALRGAGGALLARSLPVTFGFREFRIQGRDFYLNGKRIHLRALVLDNNGAAAGQASYEACRRTLEKLQAHGFNFFITHNYDFAPGKVGYMDGLARAANDVGVLSAFSMPHVKDFDWKMDNPEQAQLYRQLADWLVSRVGNHPSIVTYAMNHNACGYKGDQNPLRIDGVFNIDDPAQGGSPSRNRQQALQAADIVKGIDPTRPVYHHQSGNLGDLYTINIYLNWAPVQERSDWLEHWQAQGEKPVFFVEWGLPHVASWSTYRGPNFIWRTPARQQIWDAEYAAAEKGSAAYQSTREALGSLLRQQDLYAKGELFTWSSIIGPLRAREHNYLDIQALFLADNWRSHRARGISAALPWDQEGLWNRTPGTTGTERTNPTPYAQLEQPGIAADVVRSASRYLYAEPEAKFAPTVLGQGFLRWNAPLCAFIAGRDGDFTEKRHNYTVGEAVRKQILLVNDLRDAAVCRYQWSLEKTALKSHGEFSVGPGDVGGAALEFALPAGLAPGSYELRAQMSFADGSSQEDVFALNVLALVPAAARPVRRSPEIALYDPQDGCAELFQGYAVKKVAGLQDAADAKLLVIGRNGLKEGNAMAGLAERVRGGLRVLVLEQDAAVLSDRLGLRVNTHGLRKVFINDAAHPVFAGLDEATLRDWAGSSSLTPPYLEGADRSDPLTFWSGFENTRVWRCGNRGTVASVLPEKPERGNFGVLAKGGFDLQFAPLLEYAEGKGLVLLCQMELSGRSENDPAARRLLDNLIGYALQAPTPVFRNVYLAGGDQGAQMLRDFGVAFREYKGEKLGKEGLLVVTSGFAGEPPVQELLRNGANVLAVGLDAAESSRIAGTWFTFEKATGMPSYVDDWSSPALRFLGNEDTYWRGELTYAVIVGKGHEAVRAYEFEKGGTLVMSQAGPWLFAESNAEYFRKSQRRNGYLTGQLLRNLGASQSSPFLANLESAARSSSVPLPAAWKGKADPGNTGREAKWSDPAFGFRDWTPLRVPGAFDQQIPELAGYDGLFWYKLDFAVPERTTGEGMSLFLGAIDDESWVWLNGKFLGEVTKASNPKDASVIPRVYPLAAGDLRPGTTNNVTVLVNDTYLTGGIKGTPKLAAPGRWLESYYLTPPVADDDPYRYYRW